MNNEAVKRENGGDILAAYMLSSGRKIWIKTVGYGIKENQMELWFTNPYVYFKKKIKSQ